MSKENLTIQIGITVLDATKGANNEFYSFGPRFSNCGPDQLATIQRLISKHNQSIHEGFQPFYDDLEKASAVIDTEKKKGPKRR